MTWTLEIKIKEMNDYFGKMTKKLQQQQLNITNTTKF